MLTATFLTGYQRSGFREHPVAGRYSGLEEICQKDMTLTLLLEVVPTPPALPPAPGSGLAWGVLCCKGWMARALRGKQRSY